MSLMTRSFRPLLFAVLFGAASLAHADERSELLEMKNTIVNLIDALVEQGVIDADKARALVSDAEAKAKAANEAERKAEQARNAPVEDDVVRVTYVPEIVKQEIRNEVRNELRAEVTQEVVDVAKSEGWGTADALPDWLSRISWNGDFRVREQSDLFASSNVANQFNFNAINAAGGVGAAGPDVFLNTTEDRHRFRVRLRLGLSALVNDDFRVTARLSTGGAENPVSQNTTFTDNQPPLEVFFDRAFGQYEPVFDNGMRWLTVTAGRMQNPWVNTISELVWDRDFNFDGFAVTLRQSLVSLFGDTGAADGPNRSHMFVTAGAFPLDEIELSTDDKWLYGVQGGFLWTFENQSTIRVAAAYYDYANIRGRRNDPGSDFLDFTAPDFMQRGNTLFDIADPANANKNLLALAPDYDLLHLNFDADWAVLAPIHVGVEAAVVRNIGYDEQSVLRRVGNPALLTTGESDARVMGYSLFFTAGWPEVNKFGDWQVFWGYKYLQRDAVLDAYAESNFNRGGTNAKGWIAAFDFGLHTNTWLRARYFSADEIDGPPLGTDTIQLDLNTRF